MNLTGDFLPVPRYRSPEVEKTGMENHTDKFLEDDYILDRPIVRACLCIAYTAVFILCFFGNLIVVIVVSLHWRMRSVTKFCMGNLAFANLCVAIFCIYQNLSTFLQENWIFGQFLCKMYYFINSLSHTASILILVVICVERYLSIVHPLKCRRILTIQRLRLTIAAVWLLSGLISAPRLYYMTTLAISYAPPHAPEDYDGIKTDDNATEAIQDVICAPTPTLYNSSTAEIIFFVLLFVSPLVVMSILYTKIASIIWQSSAMLQAIQSSREINNPPIPLTVRIIRETPKVPHNSSVTESSTTSSASRSNNNTLASHNNYATKGSSSAAKTGKVLKFLPPVETVSSSHDYDSSLSYGAHRRVSGAEDEITDVTENGFAEGPCKRHLSVFAVREILRRQDPAAAVTVLRVKDERQGQVLRSRQSAIRMLILIVITFAVCNFPYYLRRICQYYVSSYDISSSFNQFLTPITFLLMYTNCAVNPILYAFLSKNFRTSFKDLLKLRLKRSYYNENRCYNHRRFHQHHYHRRARGQGFVARTSF